jgi:hypothetical protein
MQDNTEKMGDKRPVNLPGLYRHEESGTEIVTTTDYESGKIQADALVQVGYKRVGDIPTAKPADEVVPAKKG